MSNYAVSIKIQQPSSRIYFIKKKRKPRKEPWGRQLIHTHTKKEKGKTEQNERKHLHKYSERETEKGGNNVPRKNKTPGSAEFVQDSKILLSG